MLEELAGSIDWPPPSSHLADRVVAAIGTEGRNRGGARRRRMALTLGAAVILIGALIAIPTARRSVAGLLTEAGVRIGFLSEAPAVGSDLELGTEVTLEEAARGAGFALRAPHGSLGPPDAVYTDRGRVSMVWEGEEALPAEGAGRVGILLTQSAAGRFDYARKGLGASTQVEPVSVGGVPGLWLEGAPHTFTLLDPDGDALAVTTRLAANVLLWESEGVAYRLELTEDLDMAMTIVDSLESVGSR